MGSTSLLHIVFVALSFTFSKALPSDAGSGSPTVVLDTATFTGVTDGTSNRFLGIPFAEPPIGDLRFRFPLANPPYIGSHNATQFGPACSQQRPNVTFPPELAPEAAGFLNSSLAILDFPQSEDCLTLNVWTPAGTQVDAGLSVAVWIYGGGFELGGTSSYDGAIIVNRSVSLNRPIIYVSMNYRLSALGFLAGKEVKQAGVANLGLQDQRRAFQWVQKYICAFGGDPSKVTIFGESSGAMSIGAHLVANDGDTGGLFRGAFMESGSPLPVGDVTEGQPLYDTIVAQVGCTGSSDTLECLRQAPFDRLKAAMDASPSLFDATAGEVFAWAPRADGAYITDCPQELVLQGKVARIPVVNGDCDDEGTIFGVASLNVTTESAFRSYLKQFWSPGFTSTDVAKLSQAYSANITEGAPFGTGTQNALTPQFKRIAAVLGDFVFHAPRRLFLQHISGKQNTWSFLSKKFKSLPDLGSAHTSDIPNMYGPGDLTDYLINFVTNLDPNGRTVLNWPKYNTSTVQLLTLLDGTPSETITTDTFREDGISFIMELSLKHPL
ncbi:hypothetical protein EIP91_009376 [Steccherinum ochraceum]|uniref:Carboxylic ester hydrolase n=1 Tax=Steccherinum ochraceum TaxID=92696 RepID=A0A4R0R756_9APHY|nr:hypothetical protein EIP91_009376 [Steccherinum ochraceum]